MKSLVKLQFALYCVLVVCLFSFLTSCVKKYSGNKDCSEVSRNCELSKDYAVIKIIDGGKAVDAYGSSLKNDWWYVYVTQSASLLALKESTSNDLNVMLSGERSGYILTLVNQFKVDTIASFQLHGRSGVSFQTVNKVVLLETDGYFFYEQNRGYNEGLGYEGPQK